MFFRTFTPRRFQLWYWQKDLYYWNDVWLQLLLAVKGKEAEFTKQPVFNRLYIEKVRYNKLRAQLEIEALHETVESEIKRLKRSIDRG